MMLPSRLAALAAVLAMLGAAGCSSDEEEAPEAAIPSVAEPVAVEQVASLEIGRTRDGIVLTAYGVAPGIGYAAPTLVPRRGGQAASDGFLDFDFVATPPDVGFGLGQGSNSRARLVRADRLIKGQRLRGVVGVRVHGARGGQQIAF